MSNDPIHNGMIGLAWGLGARLDQERWHGYVQAYLAQGKTLEEAQALANQALGIRPKKPKTPMTASQHRVWAIALVILGVLLTAAAFGAASSPLLVAGGVLVVFGAIHGVILGVSSK